MKSVPGLVSVFAVLALLAIAGSMNPADAADLRGTISGVEADGKIYIDLPKGSVVSPGASVRIEAQIPGVGTVEIKSRWTVTEVGPGFVVAAPEGKPAGRPKAGYMAIVSSSTTASAPAAPTAPPAPAATAKPGKAAAPRSLTFKKNQLAEIRKAAEAGRVRAMQLLGLYHSGASDPSDEVPRNLDEAIRWYEKAAEKNSVDAMTALGFIYLDNRRNATKAAAWFQKAAEKGDAVAMSALARLYEEGRGVAKDGAKSFEWEKKAAEEADDIGAVAYDLAEKYFDGAGTRQDFVEAAHWFRKAADKGYAPAMTKLAEMYTTGMGLARDTKHGFEWALKAANKGSAIAMYQVGTFYLQGNGVAASAAEARKWYEKAANAGEAEGMFGLSYLYDNGMGGSADPGMAADWMILAIRSKSFQAAEAVMRTPLKWSVGFRKELQKRLSEAGVYHGPVNGKIDKPSLKAIAELAKQ